MFLFVYICRRCIVWHQLTHALACCRRIQLQKVDPEKFRTDKQLAKAVTKLMREVLGVQLGTGGPPWYILRLWWYVAAVGAPATCRSHALQPHM
jgi:hypothetical protein